MYVRDDDSYEQQKQRHKDRLLEEDLLQFFVFLSTDFVFLQILFTCTSRQCILRGECKSEIQTDVLVSTLYINTSISEDIKRV